MATVTSSAAAPEPAGQLDAVHDLAVGGWNGGGESESKSDRYLARRLAAASADYKAQMELARQSILIRELFEDFRKKNVVTDDDAKAEYDKIKEIGRAHV